MPTPHTQPAGAPFSIRHGVEFYDYGGFRSRRLPRFPALEELDDSFTRRWLFENMSEYSATTSAFIWTVRQMAAQSKWKIIGDKDDPRKEFLEGVFFKDMNQDWDDFLSSALTMLVHGWSLLEVVHKIRVGPEETDRRYRSIYSDRKVGLRMMSYRPQLSIYHWEFNDDGTLKEAQQTLDGKVRNLNSKFLLFFRTTGTRPDGVSILKGAYSPYFRGQVLEYIESIGIERDLAGLPCVKLVEGAPDVWDPENIEGQRSLKLLQQLLSDIRNDRIDGIIVPKWAEMELLSSGGGTRSLNVKDALHRYDLRLLQALLADFLQLGTATGAGSYGLGESRQSLFLLASDGFLGRIGKMVNYHIVPEILVLNGMEANDPPQLAAEPLNPRDIASLGQFFQSLKNAGLAVKATEELERFLSDATNMKVELLDQVLEPVEENTKPNPANSASGESTESS